jgi:hypothetical protein
VSDLEATDPSVDPNPAESAGDGGAPLGPDGTPFDPERWSSFVQHTKAEKQQLKEQLEAERRVWEDENALRTRLAERGWAVEDDEETIDPDLSDFEDDDPNAEVRSKLSELEQWKQQQEQQAGLEAFNTDVNGFASEAGMELSDDERAWILQRTLQSGGNPEAAKKAFDAHVEYVKNVERKAIENLRSSKKAPHVSSVGKGATQVPDLDDPDQRVQWMTERFQDASADS